MRKNTKLVLSIAIVLLLFFLITLSRKYNKLLEYSSWQQQNVDAMFKTSLSISTSAFAADYDSSAGISMANLHSASLIYGLTTYRSKNVNLNITLADLFNLMNQGIYKQTIIDKSKPIYDNLLELSLNPENKQANENLIKLIEEIKQSKK